MVVDLLCGARHDRQLSGARCWSSAHSIREGPVLVIGAADGCSCSGTFVTHHCDGASAALVSVKGTRWAKCTACIPAKCIQERCEDGRMSKVEKNVSLVLSWEALSVMALLWSGDEKGKRSEKHASGVTLYLQKRVNSDC